MNEEANKVPALQPANKLATTALENLKEKAIRNLERIGCVSTSDIMEAFADRDDKRRLTTCIEFRMDFLDTASGDILYSRSKLVTLQPEISLEKSGGFTTVILTFENYHHLDMNRIWSILTDYGKGIAEMKGDERELPILNINVVPMALGGKYGMIAAEPVFWCLQPSLPLKEGCDQIRILFKPDVVAFIRDDTFDSDEVMEKVKTELATEQIAEENRLRKEAEDEEYKKQREKEMERFMEENRTRRHSFNVNRK